MTEHFLASSCGHPIGATTSPSEHEQASPAKWTWSGSNIDFTTPYCEACKLHQGLDTAEREYQQALRTSDLTVRPARKKLLAARVTWLRKAGADTEASRIAAGRAIHKVRLLSTPAVKDNSSKKRRWDSVAAPSSPKRRKVRMSDAQQHHSEEEYRRDTAFLRGHGDYREGRWADRSGVGWLNTSSCVQDEAAGAWAATKQEDSDDSDSDSDFEDLEHLTDEELGERLRVLRREMQENGEETS